MKDLQQILLDDDIVSSINNNMNDLLTLIPELKNMMGFEHRHPHHHLDVWNHTLLALSLSKKDFDIRLSLLLHDIGKPFSYQEEEDVRHFKHHAEESEKMARTILERLGYPEKYIDEICFLIGSHDTPIDDDLVNYHYDLSVKLYEVQRCDALAHNPEKLDKRIAYLHETKGKLRARNNISIPLEDYKDYLVNFYRYESDNSLSRRIKRRKMLSLKYDDFFLQKIIDDTYAFVKDIFNSKAIDVGYCTFLLNEESTQYISLGLIDDGSADSIFIDNQGRMISTYLLKRIFGDTLCMEVHQEEVAFNTKNKVNNNYCYSLYMSGFPKNMRELKEILFGRTRVLKKHSMI